MNSEPRLPVPPAKAGVICKRIGIGVMILGLASAAWIWQVEGSNDSKAGDAPENAFSLSQSPKYQRQVEIYYGKTGLLLDQWSRDLAALTHGKPLAAVVGISSILAASFAFLLSALLEKLRKIHDETKKLPP
jgi:hypothetical protein